MSEAIRQGRLLFHTLCRLEILRRRDGKVHYDPVLLGNSGYFLLGLSLLLSSP